MGFLLLPQSAALFAQTREPAAPTEAVLRSSTRLVQVSVIVQDKKGNAITNLRPENFSIEDEGHLQRVAFFSAENPAMTHTARPLPSNVFTNRLELKGSDPGTVTVVLFDALNTDFEDQAYVRHHVIRFLQSLRPQDHVAVYALTSELLILQDFTGDSSLLVNAVNRFQPKEQAAYDASNPELLNVPALRGDPSWEHFQAAFNNASGEIADSAVTDRFRITAVALEAIADHVAGIPGRKNLIWVSGGIPDLVGFNRIGVADRDSISYEGSGESSSPPAVTGVNGGSAAGDGAQAPVEKLRQKDSLTHGFMGAAQTLNRVNVSIYPVDAHGIEVDAQGFFMRQDRRQTFRTIAERTGGKAFYGTNDIAGALRTATDDARYAYTIGYYPDHGKWDGKFRNLKIRVDVPGTQIRYRMGYYAVPDLPENAAMTTTLLQQSAFSPLEATHLGLIVTGKSVSPGPDRKVLLQVSLDLKQLLLADFAEHRQGALDLLFLQTDESGKFVAADRQRFGMNFTQTEFAMLTKSGIVLQRTLPIAQQCANIRVVVRDAGSSAIGSVSFPVKNFFPPQPVTATPNSPLLSH
jgi:VWFA-related protein